MDKYSIWLGLMVYMKKESKRIGIKALTVKSFRFEYAYCTIEDNLFYSSIKLMPSHFLKKQKDLTAKYGKINDKLIPQFKKMADFLQNEYRFTINEAE
jgi:uncharacterized protein (DUF885 family)